GLPIHFHTHDTSGAAAATVLAAVEEGVDAFDAAMDSMSGLTSQPCLGSIVAALENTESAPGIDLSNVRLISDYWEQVREQYSAFEPDIRSGASEVYLHEMPGGQFTNLKEQAASLGLGSRWPEVARAYADVNMAFGDIVKVTPSSKVVGDMALMMVTSDTSIEDVLDPDVDIAFPESVISLFAGELGQPPGGFPQALQKKVLKSREPITVRPGSLLEPVDLDEERSKLDEGHEHPVNDVDLASHLMYPKVFAEFRRHREEYGNVGILPTHVYFYGMQPEEELVATMDDGRKIVIRYLTGSETDDRGYRRIFFEVNGQPSSVLIQDQSSEALHHENEQADSANPKHVGAPMPGIISTISVEVGQEVQRGDTLLTMEAMKMETSIKSERDATIKRVLARVGQQFDAKDLLVEFE
ncbi:MAG: pyruvate carboxylase, partial [Gammaproteobacteria bacterium]|nr:pyruvate carboxylase [Gammaproteobacteria bacterium]